MPRSQILTRRSAPLLRHALWSVLRPPPAELSGAARTRWRIAGRPESTRRSGPTRCAPTASPRHCFACCRKLSTVRPHDSFTTSPCALRVGVRVVYVDVHIVRGGEELAVGRVGDRAHGLGAVCGPYKRIHDLGQHRPQRATHDHALPLPHLHTSGPDRRTRHRKRRRSRRSRHTRFASRPETTPSHYAHQQHVTSHGRARFSAQIAPSSNIETDI